MPVVYVVIKNNKGSIKMASTDNNEKCVNARMSEEEKAAEQALVEVWDRKEELIRQYIRDNLDELELEEEEIDDVDISLYEDYMQDLFDFHWKIPEHVQEFIDFDKYLLDVLDENPLDIEVICIDGDKAIPYTEWGNGVLADVRRENAKNTFVLVYRMNDSVV